jgi:hypothetical protein
MTHKVLFGNYHLSVKDKDRKSRYIPPSTIIWTVRRLKGSKSAVHVKCSGEDDDILKSSSQDEYLVWVD